MYKVFISHSSKDKPFVRKLKEDLNFNEIETWIDEDELKIGDNLYDSLIRAIDLSTHFLIVLTNQSQTSDWVQAELNNALSRLDQDLLTKIIPVVLRKTEVPAALSPLFRADFSNINFSLSGDKVFSLGDDYHKELEKIIKAIKSNSDFKLSNAEKNSIIKESDNASKTLNSRKVVAYYEVVGYSNNESKRHTIKNLKTRYKNTPLSKIALESVVPVILPDLLKPIFSEIKVGEKLFFPVDHQENVEAHFCGFSQNNSRIVVPSSIRNAFGIKSKEIVLLEVDGRSRSIKFID